MTLPFTPADVTPPLIQSVTLNGGMCLPSSAAWAARTSGLSSQVQLSGNSLAEAGSIPQTSEPKAMRISFLVLIPDGLSQPASADNKKYPYGASRMELVALRKESGATPHTAGRTPALPFQLSVWDETNSC